MSWRLSILPAVSQGIIFLTAMGGLIKAWQAKGEAAKAKSKSDHNADKLIEIHLQLNSRLDELIAASKAQGRIDERDSHTIVVPGVPDAKNP